MFIELRVQYMKITSSKHVENMMCTQIGSELAIFMYRIRNSMNNHSAYCGLVDAKIRASDKDLPVQCGLQFDSKTTS